MLKPKNTLLKPTGKSAIKIPNQEMTPKYNGTADVTGVNNNGIAYKNYGATENTGSIMQKVDHPLQNILIMLAVYHM